MRIKLTDMTVRQLAHPTTGQVKIRDESLPGFGLIVGANTKSFFVMYGTDRRTKTLGRYPEISLKEARDEAKRLLVHKPEKARSTALSGAVRAYLDECSTKNRASTVTEYRRMLALIPDKPLASVTKLDLKKPTSHQVVCWRIFFNWCIRHELTDKNPFLHIQTSVGKRERVLSDDELRAIWHYEDPPFTDMVKLLMLTGQRRSEIWHLSPTWIEGDLITVPASAYKTNRTHIYPFGEMARPYIEKAPFTFNGWSKSKKRMDVKTGVSGYVLHDLRRSYITRHAMIGTRIEISEKIVGHTSGTLGGIVGIYNHHTYLKEMRVAVSHYENHMWELLNAKRPET